MTNKKDCPENSNELVGVSVVDDADMDRVTSPDFAVVLQRIVEWKAKLPADLTHNASRLHLFNKRKLREAGSIIDDHRQTPEGRAVYNAKRRAEYEPAGLVKRAYATGKSDAEKAEHVRKQNVTAQAKFRAGMTQADKDAAAKRKREKRAERKAAEQVAADAALAARRIV